MGEGTREKRMGGPESLRPPAGPISGPRKLQQPRGERHIGGDLGAA